MLEGNDTQCGSTEALLQEFEKVNNEGLVGETLVVGSLDIKSLYPSLDITRCAEVVREKLYESEIVFKGLEWKEVALYLRYHVTDEELEKLRLTKFCPRRRHNRRPPIFVNSGRDAAKRKRYGPWRFPKKAPDDNVRRYMFCIAIEKMVIRTMKIHDFQFDGMIYRQNNGGAIGLDLTGVVADIYMCYWDKQLLRLLEEKDISTKVYMRYKDDVNMIVDKQWNGGLVTGQKQKEEAVIAEIQTMADSIDPCIQVTTDVGSRHEDGKLPILDVKVWVTECEEGEWKVMHEFHMKDVASRLVIPANSAHCERTKQNVMVNELGRIMKNCSVHLPWAETAGHLSYFMRRMQFSGYDAMYRYKVLSRALKMYYKRKQQYKNTGTMFPKRAEGDKRERNRRKNDWYKEKDRFDTVMFVEATPGSVLRRKVQEVAKRNRIKVKVVERVSCTVRNLLQKSNPFGILRCERDNCIVCEKNSDFDCRSRGCVYQIRCKECEREYRGQTGRSAYERTCEHMEDWVNKKERCPLWKHASQHHNGQRFDFDIKVMKQCFGKPTRRLITEAVVIDELPAQKTMNNKGEWSYTKLSKVNIA